MNPQSSKNELEEFHQDFQEMMNWSSLEKEGPKIEFYGKDLNREYVS